MPQEMSLSWILEKNRHDPVKAWAELLEVTLSGSVIRRIANLPKPFIYRGQQYDPFPFSHEDLSEETHKGLQKLAVRVSNVTGEVQDLLEGNDGLRGRKVTLILVNLEEPLIGDRRGIFYVESVEADETYATFVLGKTLAIDELGPGGIIDRDLFPAIRAG